MQYQRSPITLIPSFDPFHARISQFHLDLSIFLAVKILNKTMTFAKFLTIHASLPRPVVGVTRKPSLSPSASDFNPKKRY
jgi:hypothetical protein